MYRVCNRCVMDTSASDIQFDELGNCNFCNEIFQDNTPKIIDNSNSLEFLVEEIKSSGLGKKYDCIVGVSGGLDSSWALVQAVKLGLRPLAVHMDNGWNSELAQSNISNLISKLGVDLYTYVINWKEYRILMESFFKADVIDVELLYDNAMLAVNYRQALKYNVKYMLMGYNTSTEGIKMPKNWNWFKYDVKNIRSIAKLNDYPKLTSFPTFSIFDFIYCSYIRRVKSVPFLDYFEYSKENALNDLTLNYSYKPYPYKHYESIFTRFYQGYILPKKFKVDKRRVHLSSLIVSNQLGRNDALSKLDEDPYISVRQFEQDRSYFLKKMNWTEIQLDEYINRPGIFHDKYPTEKPIWEFFKKIYLKR